MSERKNFKRHFIDLYNNVEKAYQKCLQETEMEFQNGKRESYEDILEWFNNASENGKKLVPIEKIFFYLQNRYETYIKEPKKEPFYDLNGINSIFSFPSLG